MNEAHWAGVTTNGAGVSWTWRLEDADGAVVIGQESPVHSNQSDAESWVGEQWRELREAGVAQTTLVHDGAIVYGPMSLSEQ
jgi:hypothetical protein